MKRVIIDKNIMHGEPIIEGTRMPISVVLGSLADGMTVEEDIKGIDAPQLRGVYPKLEQI